MKKRLIECVPNISEGRDSDKIKAITDVVGTVDGVTLLGHANFELSIRR